MYCTVFLLATNDIPHFLELAQAENMFPRIQNAEDFARNNRVLLLKYMPTETDIDVSLGILAFEEDMVATSSTTLQIYPSSFQLLKT